MTRLAAVPARILAPKLGAFMRAERAKWGRVVRDTGATIN